MRQLFFAAFTGLIVFYSAASRAAEPSADAVLAARKYVERLKTGEVRQAAIDCWDVDALLSGSFGLMYLNLPEADRTRTQNAFADFLAAPFANERLVQLFKSIEVKEAKPTEINASTVAVRMQLVGGGGTFNAVNTLLLEKRGESWKITDQRQGDQQSIRAALVMTYVGSAKGPADTIPIVLERVASDTRKQTSGK